MLDILEVHGGVDSSPSKKRSNSAMLAAPYHHKQQSIWRHRTTSDATAETVHDISSSSSDWSSVAEDNDQPSQDPLSLDRCSFPKKRIQWADEAQWERSSQSRLPLTTIFYLPPPEPEARLRLVILLLHTVERKFEFVHAEVDMAQELRVKDVLAQLPRLASNPTLRALSYTALCWGDTELLNALSLSEYEHLVNENSDCFVAVPEGSRPRDVCLQAAVLWSNKSLRRAVRRAKLSGRALQSLQSSAELASSSSQALSATTPLLPEKSESDHHVVAVEEPVAESASTATRDVGRFETPPEPHPVSPDDDHDVADLSQGEPNAGMVILLLHPTKRVFEFVHCVYDDSLRIKVKDVLRQLPGLASNPVLAKLRYSALCCGFTELVNMLSISEYAIAGEDALVAVPEGCRSRGIMYRASALLSNKSLRHTVRKAKLSGDAVEQLTSPAELEVVLQRGTDCLLNEDDDDEDEPVVDEEKALKAVERCETSSTFRKSLEQTRRQLLDEPIDESVNGDSVSLLTGDIPVSANCDASSIDSQSSSEDDSETDDESSATTPIPVRSVTSPLSKSPSEEVIVSEHHQHAFTAREQYLAAVSSSKPNGDNAEIESASEHESPLSPVGRARSIGRGTMSPSDGSDGTDDGDAANEVQLSSEEGLFMPLAIKDEDIARTSKLIQSLQGDDDDDVPFFLKHRFWLTKGAAAVSVAAVVVGARASC